MRELLERFLEDRASLSEAEARELTAWLEVNPEALGELRAQLAMDELLSRRADEERAVFVARVKQALPTPIAAENTASEPFIATVLRRLGLGAHASHPSRSSHPWLLWAAGGCAALLAAMAFFFLRPEPPRAVLATATGDVRVWREQQTLPGKAGFVLRAGDWLLTGPGGTAEVQFPGETTRLTIGAEAEFGVVSALPDKQLKLTAGTLRASVARQSASHPMLIRTPTAKAEVLGTKFELNATKLRTQMTVEEGRVLIARTDDESGVVIEARQSATVTATEPVAVAIPPVGRSLDAGLLAYWTFDEGAGRSAADASGQGHALTLSADGAWGDGHRGRALDLHAAQVDVLSPRLELAGVFSIALWLRIQPGGPARPQPVLGCDGHSVGRDEFWLTLPPTFPGSGVALEVSGRSMGVQAFAQPGVIRAGQWHHLAVVADSAQGRASFFVDGREVTATSGLPHGFQIGGPLRIGRRVQGGPLPFDGQLDDLRIYRRALTPAEITALVSP